MFRHWKKAATVVGVAALGVGVMASTASASLLPQYQTASDGTAGYYAIDGGGFNTAGGTITTQAAADNIGGVGAGGIGAQLCDPNTGFGLQVGEVSNGSTFSVDYATGTLKGAAADHCVGDGVLANPHVLNTGLTGIPQGDDVQVWIHSWTYKKTNPGVGMGDDFNAAVFEGFDLTSGFEIFSSPVQWKLPAVSFDNAGFGVQQNTTGLSACTPSVPFSSTAPEYSAADPWSDFTSVRYTGGSGACNDVADFSDIFAWAGNQYHHVPQIGSDWAKGLAHWDALQVITTGGGLKGNVATVAPNDTLEPTTGTGQSSFSVYAGNVTS
jgi:hypothetical protein